LAALPGTASSLPSFRVKTESSRNPGPLPRKFRLLMQAFPSRHSRRFGSRAGSPSVFSTGTMCFTDSSDGSRRSDTPPCQQAKVGLPSKLLSPFFVHARSCLRFLRSFPVFFSFYALFGPFSAFDTSVELPSFSAPCVSLIIFVRVRNVFLCATVLTLTYTCLPPQDLWFFWPTIVPGHS